MSKTVSITRKDVKALRQRFGITVPQLAKDLGVHPMTPYQWDVGKLVSQEMSERIDAYFKAIAAGKTPPTFSPIRKSRFSGKSRREQIVHLRENKENKQLRTLQILQEIVASNLPQGTKDVLLKLCLHTA